LTEQPAPSRFPLSTFPRLMAAGVATRLLSDTATQIFNPFLPLIAAGLGVSVITMGRLVSLRSAMGLFAPIFGNLADRLGYRQIMRMGLLLTVAGLLLVGASTRIEMAALGMVVMGLGLFSFVPNLQAYMSARLPYARRARGLGMLEYAWALASIVGLFLAGRLMAAAGWRAPFFVLAAGLLVAWWVFGGLPPAQPGRSRERRSAAWQWRTWPRQVRDFFSLGTNARSAWSAVSATGLLMFAAMHVIIIHGEWLRNQYGLGAAELGTVSLLFGLADLCGSVLVSLVVDRLGKRRSVIIGMAVASTIFGMMPWLDVALAPAVVSIALARFGFEFTVVSLLPLISEQVPAQRGKVMTLSSAFALMGTTLSGWTGPWAYARYGTWGLGPVSALVLAIAALVIWGRVSEDGSAS
jgi:predicted MFS family arabinose efflux permease